MRRVSSSLDRLKRSDVLQVNEQNGITFFDAIGEKILTTSRVEDQPYFFGWEETVFKAYFESRYRYVDARLAPIVFNTIGEIRRTIYFRSEIVGIWDVGKDAKPKNMCVLKDLPKKDLRMISEGFESYGGRYSRTGD